MTHLPASPLPSSARSDRKRQRSRPLHLRPTSETCVLRGPSCSTSEKFGHHDAIHSLFDDIPVFGPFDEPPQGFFDRGREGLFDCGQPTLDLTKYVHSVTRTSFHQLGPVPRPRERLVNPGVLPPRLADPLAQTPPLSNQEMPTHRV